MTRLDRLILSELIGPFFGAAMLFTALAFAGGELMRVAEYLQNGESILVVAQLILVSLPGVMAYTFPMAMLLSTLLGFGRLSSDSEIVAVTAAGISFERVIAPVAIMGLIVSLVGVWFNNAVVPAASRQRNIIIDRIRSGAGNITIRQKTFEVRSSDESLLTLVHVEGDANLSTGELHQVTINLIKDGDLVTTITAPKAIWKQGTRDWVLEDFWSATKTGKSGQIWTAESFKNQEIITLDTPRNLEVLLTKRAEDIDTVQILKGIPVLRKIADFATVRKLEVEVAKRNSVPFAAFAFGLVGASLGVRPSREGRGVGFGLSVIVTFAYYVMMNISTIVAQNGLLPANIALMIPNVLGLIVAIFLIRRVMR